MLRVAFSAIATPGRTKTPAYRRSICAIVEPSSRSSDPSWYRSRGGKRFGFEFAAIVLLKLLALIVLWYVCIRPLPRADTAPAAVENHLLAAPAEATHDR